MEKNENRILLKGDMKTFEQHLKEIETHLQKKAYDYWDKWQIKGMGWEDIAQEFRVHLMRKFPQYKSEVSSFRTWANRVMLNRVKDIARGTQTRKAIPLNNAISIDELKERGIDIGYKVNYGETHLRANQFWAKVRDFRRRMARELFKMGYPREVVKQRLLQHPAFKGIAESYESPSLGAKMKQVLESILNEGEYVSLGN